MIQLSFYISVTFGVILIGAGLLMLLLPEKARVYIRMAGSTNLINYGEITIRMIPAAALIIFAESSKFPELFRLTGWFMIATSLVLYFVPRKWHHQYALICAEVLSPKILRIISPFSIFFGCFIIYAVI